MVRDMSQVIDAVAVVGMIMGDDHPFQVRDVRRQQLLPHIGTAIDQQPLAVAVDQDRRAGAAVLWLMGIAVAPVISNPRHAGRSPAAENSYFHSAAFPNRWKKLAVVA